MRKVDRILVIDDDVELCSLVGEYLEPEGFQIEAVHDGNRGLERALSGDHLLVVLDVMLPRMNGFDVLRRIRNTSRIPVLLLTARGEDVDRIVGLEIGADDYLPKPFNPRELVARIRAILRRTQAGEKGGERAGDDQIPEVVRVGDIELDPATRIVRQNGKPVELTSVEFNLLHVLLVKPDVWLHESIWWTRCSDASFLLSIAASICTSARFERSWAILTTAAITSRLYGASDISSRIPETMRAAS